MLGRVMLSVRPAYAQVRWFMNRRRLTQEAALKENQQLLEIVREPSAAMFEKHNEWLITTVPDFTEPELTQTLKALSQASEDSLSLNTTLAPVLAYEVLTHFRANQNTRIDLFLSAVRLKSLFTAAGVDFAEISAEIVERVVTKKTINEMGLGTIAKLLEALTYLEPNWIPVQTLYKTRQGEAIAVIQDCLKEAIPRLVNNDVNRAAAVVSNLLRFDRSDEELVRKLEAFVYPRLSLLSNSTFNLLPSSYSRRFRKDTSYMYSSILHPIGTELKRRSSNMQPEEVAKMLTSLTWQANNSGTYFHPVMQEMIADRINDKQWLGKSEMQAQWFIQNAADYLAQTNPSSSRELLQSLSLLTSTNRSQLHNTPNLKLAIALAKANAFPASFWDLFAPSSAGLKLNDKYRLLYYSLLQALDVAGSPLHERFAAAASEQLPSIQALWKGKRLLDTKTSSWQHTATSGFLSSRNVAHTANFYDEFMFDFAVPHCKVLVDLHPLKELLLPDFTLTGRAVHKHAVARKRGWKVVSLPMHAMTKEGVQAELETKVGSLLSQ